MDRDKLDFVIVGGIGVAVLIYLVAAILHDLGLFRSIPFYFSLPSEGFIVFLWVLGVASVLLLPIAFYLEKPKAKRQSARRTWRTVSIPSRIGHLKIGIWQVAQDEENHTGSNDA
jgi:uncharacterized membrane protein